MALNIALGDELLLALDADGQVNVRGTRLIGHRADGPKKILARRTGEEASEALEVTVALRGVTRPSVDVGAVVIGLPNLDEGIAHRLAFFVEDATTQPRDGADRWGDPVIHDDEVVIRIERELVRIERTLRLLRRPRERFGESSGHSEQRRPERDLAQEITTGLELGRQRG